MNACLNDRVTKVTHEDWAEFAVNLKCVYCTGIHLFCSVLDLCIYIYMELYQWKHHNPDNNIWLMTWRLLSNSQSMSNITAYFYLVGLAFIKFSIVCTARWLELARWLDGTDDSPCLCLCMIGILFITRSR